MRVIVSRKGFDSGYGGMASPILPDLSLLSLPIPYPVGCQLKHLRHGKQCIGDIVSQLSGGKLNGNLTVHLDPDLVETATRRAPGWRPCFGQDGAAQAHLANQGVGPGDLFLFFGWYRRTQLGPSGSLQYDRQAPGIHSFFGWLQVEEVVQVNASSTAAIAKRRPWLARHPHVQHASAMAGRNTVYVGSDELRLPGLRRTLAGAGTFARWTPDLQLTHAGQKRTIWNVPAWMRHGRPGSLAKPITYHGNGWRWSEATSPDRVILRSVSKGQEFVMHVDGHAEAMSWVARLIEAHA